MLFKVIKLIFVIFILLGYSACLSYSQPPPRLTRKTVSKWRDVHYNETFFMGKVVCGQDALDYWMQSYNWRANKKMPKLQLLLSGNLSDIKAANMQIQTLCKEILKNPKDWLKKHQSSRAVVVIMELYLQASERLYPETQALIKVMLRKIDIGGNLAGYTKWAKVPGGNGANLHGYITPLLLASAIQDDKKALSAGMTALYREIEHINRSGDFQEFNLLDSHWCGAQGWEIIKRFSNSKKVRCLANVLSERLWINRNLTWSPNVQRITGPGSRMSPIDWLVGDDERAFFATGSEKPIWLNFFFPLDFTDPQSYHSSWEQTATEVLIPRLPYYVKSLAWNKSFPNLLTSGVKYKSLKPFPCLPNLPSGKIDRSKMYTNYQTEDYTIGSTTSSWSVNTSVLAASSWWNSSIDTSVPTGSPERFNILYPHYVFNGLSPLDRGTIYYDENPSNPVKDPRSRNPGPWLKEFTEYGRVGTIQDNHL